MNPQTLRNIQTSLKSIIPLIESYIDTNPVKKELFIAIRVAISNCAINTEDCHEYSHDKKVDQLYVTLNWLRIVKEYEENYHYLTYLVDEVDMVVIGHAMSEE